MNVYHVLSWAAVLREIVAQHTYKKNRRHECSPCTWGSDPWLVRGFHIWRMGEVGPPPGHCQGDQVVFSHVNLLAYFNSKRFVTHRASQRLVLVW